MKRKYTRAEKIPLSGLLKERQIFYSTLIKRAIDKTYETRDIRKIEALEREITKTSEKALSGLEKRAKKSKLDYNTYVNLRKKGRSFKQIKEEYRYLGKTYGGYEAAYKRTMNRRKK